MPTMDCISFQKNNNAQTLFQLVMKSEWEKVVEMYNKYEEVHTAKITKAGATALHVAVSEGKQDIVKKLVDAIRHKEALKIPNEKGNTALHIAASVGNKDMCRYMLEADRSLAQFRTTEGETPLFIAALYGKKEVFVYLNENFPPDGKDCYTRSNGDNVLHVAIDQEYFDLAYQIIVLYKNKKEFLTYVNDDGVTPLKVLATKSSAFKSGTNLGRWRSLIYDCIIVNLDQLLIKKEALSPQSEDKGKNIYVGHIVSTSSKNAQEGNSIIDIEKHATGLAGYQSPTTSSNERPIYSQFMKIVLKASFFLLGLGSKRIKFTFLRELRALKEKHKLSAKIMKELVGNYSTYEDSVTIAEESTEGSIAEASTVGSTAGNTALHKGPNGKENDKKMQKKAAESTILVATKNGVTEMVNIMLDRFPVAIEDRNVEKKNILLLAAENRHASIYKLLMKRNMLRESIIRKVDENKNSVLHIAAIYSADKPWPIPGVALQMQWEIKWFQFVKNSIPPRISIGRNKDGKTPEEVFTETHKNLLEGGRGWLIKTSESCSVVAALIAGVAFASSSAIPGGTISESGKPIFEKHPAFQVFTIASLVALCFSVTSLVMFLAIITSRFQEKDFNKDLPLKLLIGLTSLFIAIGAMLICFCAGHFLVIRDKLKYAAFPVYAMTCLPVSIFAAAQFPLYIDLFWTTFMNPFDYLHRYK